MIAAMRADQLPAAGDLDGAAAWRRIIRAIEGLQWKEAAGGEAAHQAPGVGSTDCPEA
jgi:hypothetical protein